jgi:signal transduction histidine kinase
MKKLLSTVTLLIFFFINTAFASPNKMSPVNVRAGYFYNGDFMHKSGTGSYEGYDVEYYYTIASYAGYNIQFVEYDNLNAALNALKRGDIDVMSGLSKTDERIQDYLISITKMCSSSIAIQTRITDDRFTPSDISSMADMTCGILKGSNVILLYQDWCKRNELIPHIIEYDTITLRNEALESGKVDAIAAGSTINGAQKIAEFPSLDLFFMFNKNKPQIKKQFDRAMGILSLENPTYSFNLYRTHFPLTRNSLPSFFIGEKQYISTHSIIKIALLSDDAPFSKQEQDGSLQGILPEYYTHLSEKIGIQFEFVPFATKDAACAALLLGEVDLVAKFGNNIYDATNKGVVLTVPYINMNLVQITRSGTNSISKIAIPQCNIDTVNASFSQINSPLSFSAYANSELCFAALKSRIVDAVVCTQPAATWLLNRNRSSSYVVSDFGNMDWSICGALPTNTDGNTLRAILNKTINVDGNYINQLITNDTLQDSADFSNAFDKIPVSFIAICTLILAILFTLSIVAIIIIIRRRKTEKKLAAQQMELSSAVKANEARNAFFGAISHDMRTPLNAIVGFAGLAEKENNISSIKKYLIKIQSSGELLNSLLDDTLTLSKANSGKLELHLEPANTEDLLESIIIPIREAAEKKHITFTVDSSKAPYRTVLIDKLGLQKILLNLLTNAIKYTHEDGHISFTIYHEPIQSDSPDTVFVVKDDGIGISNEFLPHLYEPFAQEKRHGYESTGTGLGLSIVKQLVDKMNGVITVQTKQNKGTTFTVRLHFDKAKKSIPVQKRVNPSEAKLRGKKILLCEDNEMNSEIACALLQEKGISVTTADNGQLGLRLFTASNINDYLLILMDVRMPIMDGYETTKKIRALDRPDAKTIPIIAMTADAFADDIHKCLAAGMNSHVSKPIDPEKLFTEIARFCK